MSRRKKPIPLNSRGGSLYDDAGKLFSNVLDERLASSRPGRFLMMIFGKDNVRNLALLADPLSKFKLASYKVAAVNRTKTLVMKRRTARSYSRTVNGKATSSIPNAGTPYAWDYLFPGTIAYSKSTSSGVLADQVAIVGFRKDTSRSTRPVGVDEGEFELFAPAIHSSSRSWAFKTSDSYVRYDAPYEPYNLAISESVESVQTFGPAGTVTQAQIDAYRLEEQTNADQMLSKYTFGMLDNALPTYRPFSLGRSIIELRDLARSTADTILGVSQFVSKKFGSKEASSQYLNEKFGWENTLKDLRDLLESPDKVAKRINFLLARENKPTTFRARRRFLQPMNSPPSFAYAGLPGETSPVVSTSGVREVELRLSVNVRVRLPGILPPNLRRSDAELDVVKNLLDNRLSGYLIRPADLYRLIPWSWLGDWFESVGDYIEAIDAINADESLVNYGFATYNSVATSKTNYQANVTRYLSRTINGVNTSWTETERINHTSRVISRYQKRKDIATVNGVKRTWDMASLSTFQKSILGALLLQRR
jgi:hypothetical protein